MSLAEFAKIFAPAALQLQATDADEAMIRAYYLALKDLEIELIAMAAERFARGAADWFPKSSQWRAMALKIEGERYELLQRALRTYHERARAALCRDCDDTGWRETSVRSRSRWQRCRCQSLRRLEVLGRRPMPSWPEENTESFGVLK